MKTIFKLGLLCISVMSAAMYARAQVTSFTYQGRLDDNSAPASGTYDLSFSAFDANTNGNLIAGPVTNSAVAVSNGLFTVTLDFGTGAFDGSPRWLEIGVSSNGTGGNFTVLAPRQAITATPYAIYATTAAENRFCKAHFFKVIFNP